MSTQQVRGLTMNTAAKDEGMQHWFAPAVVALWALSATRLGKIGLFLLVLGGIGEVMGAVLDINHKLHGPAAMIGIPSQINDRQLTAAASANEQLPSKH